MRPVSVRERRVLLLLLLWEWVVVVVSSRVLSRAGMVEISSEPGGQRPPPGGLVSKRVRGGCDGGLGLGGWG